MLYSFWLAFRSKVRSVCFRLPFGMYHQGTLNTNSSEYHLYPFRYIVWWSSSNVSSACYLLSQLLYRHHPYYCCSLLMLHWYRMWRCCWVDRDIPLRVAAWMIWIQHYHNTPFVHPSQSGTTHHRYCYWYYQYVGSSWAYLLWAPQRVLVGYKLGWEGWLVQIPLLVTCTVATKEWYSRVLFK